MSKRVLAIDAGKTGTRMAYYDNDVRGSIATGGGIDNVASIGGIEQIRSVLASILAQLDEGPCDAVCIGMTGVLEPDQHAKAVSQTLFELLQAPRVVVTSDVVTNYCGALGPNPGVVVAAGTGSIILGAGPDGTLARVDGWGYLLDDAGSAFAIGQAGVREVLRCADGRGGSQRLHQAAMELFGSTAALVDRVYGSANPARVIAGFAREVSRAAGEGDRGAAKILSAAATELAAGAAAAAVRVFEADMPVPVSWQGGVFRSGPHMVAPFVDQVRTVLPNARFHEPAGDALDGAAALAARNEATVLEGLLFVRQEVVA